MIYIRGNAAGAIEDGSHQGDDVRRIDAAITIGIPVERPRRRAQQQRAAQPKQNRPNGASNDPHTTSFQLSLHCLAPCVMRWGNGNCNRLSLQLL